MLAGVLAVAVVAVAYGSAAPQLGIAEFAPSAQRSLEAPPTTAAATATESGAARNRGRSPAASTTTAPPATVDGTAASAPTTRVGRTRDCVGQPPRQTEDPQSPPCVAVIFDGDNSGATARGVSETEIRVGIPRSSTTYDQVIEPLFEYFNQRYELYGRRLRPVLVTGSTNDPVTNRAVAVDTAAQGVFAALSAINERNGSLQDAYWQELARNEVISVALGAGGYLTDRALFDPLHPYLWSVYPSAEDLWRNVASFACTSLAGRPARLAPDAGLRDKTRKFGVLANGNAKAPWIRPLVDGLSDCGQTPTVTEVVSANAGGPTLATAFERLRAAGVTTVVCACEFGSWISAHSSSHSLNFHPEWLQASERNVSNDGEYFHQHYSNFGMRPFGVMEQPKLQPNQAQAWLQALLQVRPTALNDTTFMSNVFNFYAASAIYDTLMVLAAGIQAAGPNLTPGTFAQGLMSTTFPNPGAGQAPYFQPSVGFGAGDHSFYDDYALAWWEPTAEPVGLARVPGARGSWCYVGAGSRFTSGSYPADDSRIASATEPCR